MKLNEFESSGRGRLYLIEFTEENIWRPLIATVRTRFRNHVLNLYKILPQLG
jgi:hypothetical protein